MAATSGEIARRVGYLRHAGVILTLAAVMVAGVRAGTAGPTPVEELKGPARERVLHVLGDDEVARRVDAIRAFPGDHWSQGDAFHGRESEIVRGQTSLNKVALESVLDVLDADLRARRVPDRQAGVPPCKPRPQYD